MGPRELGVGIRVIDHFVRKAFGTEGIMYSALHEKGLGFLFDRTSSDGVVSIFAEPVGLAAVSVIVCLWHIEATCMAYELKSWRCKRHSISTVSLHSRILGYFAARFVFDVPVTLQLYAPYVNGRTLHFCPWLRFVVCGTVTGLYIDSSEDDLDRWISDESLSTSSCVNHSWRNCFC